MSQLPPEAQQILRERTDNGADPRTPVYLAETFFHDAWMLLRSFPPRAMSRPGIANNLSPELIKELERGFATTVLQQAYRFHHRTTDALPRLLPNGQILITQGGGASSDWFMRTLTGMRQDSRVRLADAAANLAERYPCGYRELKEIAEQAHASPKRFVHYLFSPQQNTPARDEIIKICAVSTDRYAATSGLRALFVVGGFTGDIMISASCLLGGRDALQAGSSPHALFQALL